MNHSTQGFDFDGGALCLDFANTLEWHASPTPDEHLRSYPDLVAWGRAAGGLSGEESARLLTGATSRPEESAAVLEQARRLREVIYRVFSAVAANSRVESDDLAAVNSWLQEALSHLEVKSAADGFQWGWGESSDSLGSPLWPVARSAGELLTSDHLDRVKECPDDRGCGYLFVDMSRNRSRVWCSMEACGNRAKAQRHYQRSRTSGGQGAAS